MKKTKTTQYIRIVVQILFFGVFFVLMMTNKAQIWMGLIFLSIALAAVFGRYYCGWMCPIYTLIRPARRISQKLKLTQPAIPESVKSGMARLIVLALFLPALGYTIYTVMQGQKFPLPVFIITLGVLTTLFINQNTWHRYLCPWGILFSTTGKYARMGLSIEGCTGCGACAKICPAEAVVMQDKKAVMTSRYCLLCLQCKDVCPVQAISIGKL